MPTLTHDSSTETLDIGQAGGTLASANAADATWFSEPGPIAQDEAAWVFPGTNIVFSRNMGCRTRPILWHGTIRCTDAGLAALRTAEDLWRFKGGLFTYEDDVSEYGACRIVSLSLARNRRRIVSDVWDWLVEYEIKLEQLAP